MKLAHKFCAWICAALLLVPLAACSEGNQKSVQAGTLSGDQSTGTQIVGKVTSVVGNQVTLAIGTLSGGESSASGSEGRRRSGKTSSGGNSSDAQATSSAASSVLSSAASEKSGTSSSSGLIALTGETETLLIPVGLTLTEGRSGSSRSFGTGSSQGGSQGNARGSAVQRSAQGKTQGSVSGGGFSGGSGGTQGGSNGKSGGSAATLTAQRTRDFSSITKGMILQITEKTLSDGTQGIVKVAVLSE